MGSIKRLLGRPAILLVGLVALLGQHVHAAAVEPHALLDKRQTLPYTPVVGEPTRVVERRSITALQSGSPDVFNMLILAWQNVAARAEANETSYYQIAGQ